MSQLIMKGHNGAEFKLNVTQFQSTLSSSINTVQTRKMSHHFPIRAGQPDIQFTVQFPSIRAHHDFRDFVRDHQRNSQTANYAPGSTPLSRGAVTLMWPERNIINWTGYIVNMPVREARFVYAPKVTFGVALMDSLLSESTTGFSLGGDFATIIGAEIAAYVPFDPQADITPPTPPASQQPDPGQQAQGLIGGIFSSLNNFLNNL
jgi:hypothetical protein